MEVKNISWNENGTNNSNHPLLPQSLRGLIVGKSDCGKTTLTEPSASTRLAGLFKVVSFWQEFVSTRIQNFEKRFRRTIA